MTQTLETRERIKVYKVSPELYDAMTVLSDAAAQELDADLAELINIRASQINRCAACTDVHTHEARERGILEQKLALLAAWDEAGDLYTERERAALALTEAITELTSRGRVSGEVYSRASAVFCERELGQVIAMAVTINAWNRIGVTARKSPSRRP
jgi:AhpD family alkylhydroperoxidase